MKNKTKALLMLLCALTMTCAMVACGRNGGGSSTDNSSNSTESSSNISSEDSSSDDSSSDDSSFDDTSSDNTSSDESSSSGGEVEIPETYFVTVNACDGVTVTVAETVEEDKDVTFTLVFASIYEKGNEFAVTAMVGGESAALQEENGTYTISAVKGDVVINVTGAVKKNFNIIKEAEDGVVIHGADTVAAGEDYYFTVRFETGYAADEDFAVLIDGEAAEYDADKAQYVVKNVTYGFMIEVMGVKEVVYSVTYSCEYADAVANEAASLKGTSENYVFTIILTEKYTQCLENIEVYYSVAGVETKAVANENGEYVVANPQADMIIVVKNVSLNTYKVDFLYNGEVKYTQEGITVGTALTEEQLAAAKDAVMADLDGTFVGWQESLGLVQRDFELNAIILEGETENLGNGFVSAAEIGGAPVGYEKAYKETAVWNEENASTGGAKTVWANIAQTDIEPYKAIYFQMKVEKTWILFDGWSHALINRDSALEGTIAVWTLVKLEKVTNGWNVTFDGTTTFREGMSLNEILTFEYDARSADTGNDDCVPAEITVTDMIAVKDENYIAGKREIAVEKLFVNATEDANVDAPSGFNKVYHEVAVWEEVNASPSGAKTVWAKLASVNVDKYKQIKFQVKVDMSWILFDGWGHYFNGNGQWVPVTMTKTDAGWDIEFIGGAGTKTTRVGNNLKTLLAMELDARSTETGNDDCVPAEIWVTEIIGVLDENYVAPPQSTKIEDSAFVGTEVDNTVAAPDGYSIVSTRTNFRGKGSDGSVDPSTYSRLDISGYSEVKFMTLYTTNYYLWDGWNACWKDTEWVEWKFVNKNDGTWTFTATGSGTNVYTTTVTGNALVDFLGCEAGDGGQVWVTELIGTKANGGVVDPTPNPDPIPTVIGEKVADGAYELGVDVGGGAKFEMTSEITVAAGFESVYKYQSTEGMIHGKNFSNVDLTAYKTVTFALKAASFNFNQEATKEMSDWMIFTLTQTSTNTWNLLVSSNGEVIFEKTGLNGAYNTNENYRNNALDAILYGNPAGFYPQAKDGNLTVYVTEVRGEKA